MAVRFLKKAAKTPVSGETETRETVAAMLREIARELESLAAASTPARDEPGPLRRERLASLLPKPARLSPYRERAQLRRQFGLQP